MTDFFQNLCYRDQNVSVTTEYRWHYDIQPKPKVWRNHKRMSNFRQILSARLCI